MMSEKSRDSLACGAIITIAYIIFMLIAPQAAKLLMVLYIIGLLSLVAEYFWTTSPSIIRSK